jgi:hypothetical protein
MKFFFETEETKQISSGAIFKDKVKFLVVLERVVEFDQEGMLNLG